MPLTNSQKKAFRRWLKKHDIARLCEMCGSTDQWNVHDGLLGALELDLENQKASASKMGFFALSCRNCWHTRFFSAAPILGEKSS